MIVQAILILVLLLFAFFFAMMEVAFVSANKLRIELDKKQNSHFSQMIEMYIDKPAQYYSTMAIGNLLVVVSLAMVLATAICGGCCRSMRWLLLPFRWRLRACSIFWPTRFCPRC